MHLLLAPMRLTQDNIFMYLIFVFTFIQNVLTTIFQISTLSHHFTIRYSIGETELKDAKKAKLGVPVLTEDKESNHRLIHRLIPYRPKIIVGGNNSPSTPLSIAEVPKVSSHSENDQQKVEKYLTGIIKKRDDIIINKWVSIL